MSRAEGSVDIVEKFCSGAAAGTRRYLRAISSAESLTDHAASLLFRLFPVTDVDADDFIYLLKYSGLVSQRNREWSLATNVKMGLYQESIRDSSLFAQTNRAIIDISTVHARTKAQGDIPAYLNSRAGRAFHLVALKQDGAASGYTDAVIDEPRRSKWLACKLSNIQKDVNLLSDTAIEPSFASGCMLFEEGNFEEAMGPLHAVLANGTCSRETAISNYLLGRIYSRANQQASKLHFENAVLQCRQLALTVYLARSLHSLAMLIRQREAERARILLEESLAIGIATRDPIGEVHRLHSLANVIYRSQPGRAEELLRRALSLAVDVGDVTSIPQISNSLALRIRRRRPEEAASLLRMALGTLDDLGDRKGRASLLRTLAFTVEDSAATEVENFLKESAVLNKQTKDRDGEATSLVSLGDFYRGREFWAESKKCYLEATNVTKNNRRLSYAYLGLSTVAINELDMSSAIHHLQTALVCQRLAQMKSAQKSTQAKIQQLKRILRLGGTKD